MITTICINCKRQEEIYMDKASEKVYCCECESEIVANHFLKMQLKTLRQFKEKKKSKFAVKCDKCGKEDTPKLKDDDVVCFSCFAPLKQLTTIFKNMLKEYLKSE